MKQRLGTVVGRTVGQFHHQNLKIILSKCFFFLMMGEVYTSRIAVSNPCGHGFVFLMEIPGLKQSRKTINSPLCGEFESDFKSEIIQITASGGDLGFFLLGILVNMAWRLDIFGNGT